MRPRKIEAEGYRPIISSRIQSFTHQARPTIILIARLARSSLSTLRIQILRLVLRNWFESHATLNTSLVQILPTQLIISTSSPLVTVCLSHEAWRAARRPLALTLDNELTASP